MNALASYRRILGNVALTRLLAGEFVSAIGDWLYLVALLVVVERSSGDPVLLGIVGAARVLPYVVLSVPAGFIADRFERRLVLLVTDVARAAIMVAMGILVATGGPLWAIVALAILATCFSTFFGPTLGAYLPTLVRDETELGPANSAWATLDNLAYVIGPTIAGVLLATSGAALAFLINAGSFLVVIAVLWSLPRPPATEPVLSLSEPETNPSTADAPARTSLLASLRPRLPAIVSLGALDCTTSAVFGGLGILTVVLASHGLGTGDDATGPLNASMGVGGLIGAVVAGAVVLRPRLGRSLLGGGGVVAIGLIALAASVETGAGLAAAVVGLAVASLGSLMLEVVTTTLLQRAVPDEMRGRTLGAIASVSILSLAIGSLVLPIAAAAFGIAVVLVVSAAAIVLAAVGVAVSVGSLQTTSVEGTALLARLRALPIFDGVPSEALDAATRQMKPVHLEPGAVLIRQGDAPDRFYFVAAGRLRVERSSDRDPTGAVRIDEIGPDEVVGELGLLRGQPRNATVIAETPTDVLALDGGDFLVLVSAGPALRGRLLDLRRAGLSADVGPTEPASRMAPSQAG